MAQPLDLGRLRLVFACTAVLLLIYGFFSTDSWEKQEQNNNLLLFIRKVLWQLKCDITLEAEWTQGAFLQQSFLFIFLFF